MAATQIQQQQKSSASPIEAKQLEALGLKRLTTDSVRSSVPRVVWLVKGKAKTGKSHLAFDAPGPIGFINIDKGEEGTVEKFLEGDAAREIWGLDVMITRAMIANPNAEIVKAKCEPELTRCLKAYDGMLLEGASTAVRSIVIDTWSELFSLGCFARIGKDKQFMPQERTKVNGIFSSMIHDALYATKNVILLAKTTEFDGEVRTVGYNQSEGLVQAVIATDKKIVRRGKEQSTVFTYTITDCRQNKDLEGEMFTSEELGEHPFATLAAAIVPGTKPRDWR